jgi:predicted DNA binding CopG/RHH family protein
LATAIDEIKATASKKGMEYSKFIAETLEQAVEKSS